MFNVGTGELVLILLLALIVLGPDKLPEVARQVGRWRAEFQRMSGGFQREFRDAMDSAMASPPRPADDADGAGSFSLPAITGQEAEPPGPERVAESAPAPQRPAAEATAAGPLFEWPPATGGNGVAPTDGASPVGTPASSAGPEPAEAPGAGPASADATDEPEPPPRMMVYGPPGSFE